MGKMILAVVIVCVLFFGCAPAFCAQKELPKEKIIAIAKESAQAKGFKLEAVRVIYDKDGRLWSERFGYATGEIAKNHGILIKGFLKNYRIVYFDFKEPIKDVWVFVDKDTGDVFEVYQEK